MITVRRHLSRLSLVLVTLAGICGSVFSQTNAPFDGRAWNISSGNLEPTIQAAYPLRDLCDFDVLDELLIADGALTTNRY
jgi:hypothetical protein